MFNTLLNQARALLGRRYASDNIQWRGQMGFACPQLGIHDYIWNKNRVVNQGLNHLLNAGLRGEGVITTLFLAPYVADIVPPATVTAANFGSTLIEFINYDSSARPQWVSDGPSTAQLIENAAAPALFVVSAGGAQDTINGAGLMSTSVKGGTGGILVAAAKAPSTFAGLAAGFEVKIKYRITGTSA